MAQGTPDIRVLVGVEGGASIDGKSGQLIAQELSRIAKDISTQKAPKVAFTVNTQLTSQNITKQLNEIVKGIQLNPIDLNIRTNQSSIENFAEDEYRKIIDSAKGPKSRSNIVAYIEEKRALAELNVQKAKDVAATKQQENENKNASKSVRELVAEFEQLKYSGKSLNAAENYANKLGKSNLLTEISQLRNSFGELNEEANHFLAKIGGLDNLGKHINDNGFETLATNIKNCNKSILDIKRISTVDNPLFIKNERIAKNARDVSDFALSLSKFEKANDKFKGNAGLSTEFERIKAALEDIKHRTSLGKDISIDLDMLKKRTNDWKSSLDAAGLSGQTAFGKLRAQMDKLSVYFSATVIMMGSMQQIKQITNNVIALDTAMTELKKVTDETDVTYTKFLANAEVRAKSIGASLTDTITATADFARLGYSLSEAEQISDAALVYKNVGDGIKDINAASESVISTMKAFGVEASNAMSIVDRFNEVGNNFAISSKGVGDALQRSASALATAGNSIDESIALIVGANAVVNLMSHAA